MGKKRSEIWRRGGSIAGNNYLSRSASHSRQFQFAKPRSENNSLGVWRALSTRLSKTASLRLYLMHSHSRRRPRYQSIARPLSYSCGDHFGGRLGEESWRWWRWGGSLGVTVSSSLPSFSFSFLFLHSISFWFFCGSSSSSSSSSSSLRPPPGHRRNWRFAHNRKY